METPQEFASPARPFIVDFVTRTGETRTVVADAVESTGGGWLVVPRDRLRGQFVLGYEQVVLCERRTYSSLAA